MLPDKNSKNPAKINLKNIKAFIQGKVLQFTEAFGLLSDYKKEQVLWRAELAKECMERKSCTYCGCETPAKFYSDGGCEDPDKHCYPEMMEELTWKQYKEDNQIHITIE